MSEKRIEFVIKGQERPPAQKPKEVRLTFEFNGFNEERDAVSVVARNSEGYVWSITTFHTDGTRTDNPCPGVFPERFGFEGDGTRRIKQR